MMCEFAENLGINELFSCVCVSRRGQVVFFCGYFWETTWWKVQPKESLCDIFFEAQGVERHQHGNDRLGPVCLVVTVPWKWLWDPGAGGGRGWFGRGSKSFRGENSQGLNWAAVEWGRVWGGTEAGGRQLTFFEDLLCVFGTALTYLQLFNPAKWSETQIFPCFIHEEMEAQNGYLTYPC